MTKVIAVIMGSIIFFPHAGISQDGIELINKIKANEKLANMLCDDGTFPKKTFRSNMGMYCSKNGLLGIGKNNLGGAVAYRICITRTPDISFAKTDCYKKLDPVVLSSSEKIIKEAGKAKVCEFLNQFLPANYLSICK